MISCQTYRANLRAGTQDAEVLEHLRTCDACLDFSVGVDPDNFFRSIGGTDMVPPGGVDAFVGDVMRQVQIRGKETTMATRGTLLSWRHRLAIAATIAAAVTGATFVFQHERHVTPAPVNRAAAVQPRPVKAPARVLTTKPIVDSYQSRNATIVEMPGDGNVNVVMIFDDKLPADL
jgi:hypothetical protein